MSGSAYFALTGPYALVDRATNRVAITGLDADGVERELFAGAAEDSAPSSVSG